MRECGCPSAGTVTDPRRHADWHEQIKPLERADYMTIWKAHGRVVPPERTYVDAQFERARGKSGYVSGMPS